MLFLKLEILELNAMCVLKVIRIEIPCPISPVRQVTMSSFCRRLSTIVSADHFSCSSISSFIIGQSDSH